MAAVSSKNGSSTTKTIRITYQQLVELAEQLDKDKEEKSTKRRRKVEHETDTTDNTPTKYEQRQHVHISAQNELTPDTQTTEKKASAEKKKKDPDKKKRKERRHERNEEKSPPREEVLDEQVNRISELSDGDDGDQLKTKDKKKHRKKSSKSKEKSSEETADIEDSLEKLELEDNAENVKKHKTKHKDQKTKKTSDSKKKDKKKSTKTKVKIDEDPTDELLTDEKVVHKDEKEENEHNDQSKHGILRTPNSKHHHHHGHVSFSENNESHIIDYKTNDEPGILRIPKGVHIHEDEGLDANDRDIQYGRNSDVFESVDDENNTDIPRKQPDDSQSPDSRNKSSESEHSKLSVAEKRLRALNRQRAQQLAKQAHHVESSLSNILSKGITDQSSLNRIFTLSKEIQDLYQGVIMLDLSYTQQNDIDQRLWKNAFYQVIETFRKYGKLFLGYSNQKDTISPERINAELGDFLVSSSSFYSNLLSGLQKTYHFDIQDIVNQPRKADFLARSAKLALLTCHHILIFLGDLERYKENLQPSSNWSNIRSWYLKASKLAPKNGKPYNQLAVIAVYANRKLDAVFYYIRSLCVNSPILTAREKLTTIFYEIQKKADQLQHEEEMHRKQEHLKTQRERKNRNVFKEAAKGTGLVGGQTNHGRHEVWVFIQKGKCRRLVLTETGAVQQVDATGKPITRESQNEQPDQPKQESKQDSPKISLQEVNKKFMLHFLCAHGFLYTRIGMERLPSLQVQLIGELQTLLKYPQCSSVGYIPLLQMAAVNMFAIEHTAPLEDTKEPFVRLGTPQDQALHLATDMLVSLLHSCTDILTSTDGNHGNNNMLSATLRQYIPTVKVWFDWMLCHQDLWQASNMSVHKALWESVAQFTNTVLQLDLPSFDENENGELVTLHEDEFLAGFKPLADAMHFSVNVDASIHNKELVQDYLYITAIRKFAMCMSSMDNPTLQYCEETQQFSAVLPSISKSPEKRESSLEVHMDVEHKDQESFDSDEVVIEGVWDEVDSGDEVDKGFKELKAKKEQLAKELEDHEQKHTKARAVVQEHVSKANLMFENSPAYLVPDTNCFIDQLSGLQAIVMSNDFTLVVPIVVINELDGLKKDLLTDKYHDYNHAQMVMNNARAAIDFLEDQFSLRSPYVKALTSKGTVMDTIAFRSEDTSSRTGNNDDLILSCCLHYCDETFVNRLATVDQPITIRRNVVLLTDDRNLRVKAYTRNVPVLTVPQFRQMSRL